MAADTEPSPTASLITTYGNQLCQHIGKAADAIERIATVFESLLAMLQAQEERERLKEPRS